MNAVIKLPDMCRNGSWNLQHCLHGFLLLFVLLHISLVAYSKKAGTFFRWRTISSPSNQQAGVYSVLFLVRSHFCDNGHTSPVIVSHSIGDCFQKPTATIQLECWVGEYQELWCVMLVNYRYCVCACGKFTTNFEVWGISGKAAVVQRMQCRWCLVRGCVAFFTSLNNLCHASSITQGISKQGVSF